MQWVIVFYSFGGPEAQGDLIRWFQLGGLWNFVAFHGAFGLIGFMLRQFEIAGLVGIRPYNAFAFSAVIAVFTSIFLIYPLGQQLVGSSHHHLVSQQSSDISYSFKVSTI